MFHPVLVITLRKGGSTSAIELLDVEIIVKICVLPGSLHVHELHAIPCALRPQQLSGWHIVGGYGVQASQ